MFLALFCSLVLCTTLRAQVLPSQSSTATDQAVHALCDRQIALLGESPTHGFGEALAVKVEIVRRLVNDCHYNALFFEAGTYDFLRIERGRATGEPITGAAISAAIGGLWANEEVQSLVPFLQEKVQAGKLRLGGLDDQLGAGTYASKAMAPDLVRRLEGAQKMRCLATFERHLQWQYTEDAPYGPAEKAKLLGCLDAIDAELAQPGVRSSAGAAEDGVMVASLRRNLARNFTEDDFRKPEQARQWMNDRDLSMETNFEWLAGGLPKGSQIIVWAATVHLAKSLDGIKGFEGRVPQGSYIRRKYGDQAFVLGFSALGGEYAFIHPPAKPLSAAPDSSIEARALAHTQSGSVYVDRKELQNLGAAPGRLLGTGFDTANWDEVVDGVVIIRRERSPVWLKN